MEHFDSNNHSFDANDDLNNIISINNSNDADDDQDFDFDYDPNEMYYALNGKD